MVVQIVKRNVGQERGMWCGVRFKSGGIDTKSGKRGLDGLSETKCNSARKNNGFAGKRKV